MADYNNTNRGSLWVRKDGLKADPAADKSAPLFSGPLDVEGKAYTVSVWGTKPKELSPEALAAIVNFRKATVALSKALGANFDNERIGGAPVLKINITPRDGGPNAGRPSNASAGSDLSSLF